MMLKKINYLSIKKVEIGCSFQCFFVLLQVLMFEKTQINLVFCSLNRTFEAAPRRYSCSRKLK